MSRVLIGMDAFVMDLNDSSAEPMEELKGQGKKELFPHFQLDMQPAFPNSSPSLKKIQLLSLSDEPPVDSLSAFGTVPNPPAPIIKPPPAIFSDLWGEQEELPSAHTEIPQTNTLAINSSLEERQNSPGIEHTLFLPEEKLSTLPPLDQENIVGELWEHSPETISEDWPEQTADSFDDLSLFDDLDFFDIDGALAKQEAKIQQQEYKRKRTPTYGERRIEGWGGVVSLIHVNWEDAETAEQDALERLGCVNIPMSKETRDFIIQAARNARLPHRLEVYLTTQLAHVRQQLASLPLPDEEETVDPYAERRQALQAEITDIEQTLTSKMQWVAIKKAARYYGQGIDFEDLIQFGIEGVIAGIQHYDITRKARLLVAVDTWTFQAITRAIADYGGALRLPAYTFEHVKAVKKHQQQWEREHGRLPTPQELAHIMNMPISDILNVLRSKELQDSARKALSIEHLKRAEYLNEGYSFQDAEGCLFANNDEFAYILGEITGQQMLEILYRELSPRQRLVFSLRAGLHEGREISTLDETGKRLHITRERVRQIERNARKKMIYQWMIHLRKHYPEIPIPKEHEEEVEGKIRGKRQTEKIEEIRQLISEQRQIHYNSRAEVAEKNDNPIYVTRKIEKTKSLPKKEEPDEAALKEKAERSLKKAVLRLRQEYSQDQE